MKSYNEIMTEAANIAAKWGVYSKQYIILKNKLKEKILSENKINTFEIFDMMHKQDGTLK